VGPAASKNQMLISVITGLEPLSLAAIKVKPAPAVHCGRGCCSQQKKIIDNVITAKECDLIFSKPLVNIVRGLAASRKNTINNVTTAEKCDLVLSVGEHCSLWRKLKQP
jgi:hypothetical protein